MLFLQSHNVSTGLAVKIYKEYGDDAIAVVQSDPYRLARDIYGIGFITADKIARELGIAADAPERVAAGVAYVLSQAADEGNVYLPAGELTRRAGNCWRSSRTGRRGHRSRCVEAEQVWVEDAQTCQALWQVPGSVGAGRRTPGLPDPVLSRRRSAWPTGCGGWPRRLNDRLPAFQGFDWPAAFAALQAQTHLPLTPRQQEAAQAALTHRVTVLTGGPGTGKTTTVRTIIRLAEAAGAKTVLASPTGRAAKRLSEATGRPAKTIHRLLEFKPADRPGLSTQRGQPAGSRPGHRGRSLHARSAADQPPAEGDPIRRAPAAGGRHRPTAQRRRGERAA